MKHYFTFYLQRAIIFAVLFTFSLAGTRLTYANANHLESVAGFLNTDATLSDLTVDGTTVDGFNTATLTYDVVLPSGTATVPTVAGTATDAANADVSVTDATGLPGTTTVLVTAEDGTTTQTYTVNFTVAANTDATLSDLTVDGTTVTDFASGTFTYDVILPFGTATVPTVTGTATDANANFSVTDAAGLPGTTTIEVIAADGTTAQTYTVNFTIAANTDATLSDLTVDGTTVADFASGTLTYDVILQFGTATVPTVAGTAADAANADVSVTPADQLPGASTVLVTAEDGTTTQTYTVNFTVAANTDATLSDLTANGTTLEGFDPDVLTYDVELPAGTTASPNIVATASDVRATVSVTKSGVVPGTATIVVTAEDGTTSITYTINFTIATAVTELRKGTVKLYPNPATTILNFSVEVSKAEIYNIAGKKVKTALYSGVGIDISELLNGIYLVHMELDNGETVIRKLIKR